MEYNEVFSVSRSTMFGRNRLNQNNSNGAPPASDRASGGYGGIDDAYMWNSSPVDSLRVSAVSGGKKPKQQHKQNQPEAGETNNTAEDQTSDRVVIVDYPLSAAPAVLQLTEGKGVNVDDVAMAEKSVETTDRRSDEDANVTRRSKSRAGRWLELCHCSRDLFAVKLFYFAFIGSLGIVFTYAVVFLKQHGLSAFEIGVISGIRPVLGFLSAPAWGAAGDRYGIRRILMIVSLFAWLAFFVALYTVDEPERRPTCPDSMAPFLQRNNLHKISRRGLGDGVNLSASYEPTWTTSSVDSTSITFPITSAIDTNASSTSPKGNRTFSSQSYDESTSSSSSRPPNNASLLSDSDQELLREDLLWLYEPSSRYRVFIICLLVICGGELFQAPTTAMSDAATLQILGRDRLHEYGAQRAWGPVGWAISSFITGSILDRLHWNEVQCGVELSFTDYRVVSYLFIPAFVLGFIAALKINFSTKNADEPDLGDPHPTSNGQKVTVSNKQHSAVAVIKVFLNVRNGSWMLTTFFVGTCNGVIWGFLFWHLDNLGGSKLLMGVDGVVVCLFEFIAFFVVDYVIKVIGHMGVMYVGLIGYIIRFAVYACVTNPWLILPVETLQGVTFSFIWVSLSQYTAIAVPSASLGTVQGIIHGVYFGLGNGIGHFVGGILISQFGAVTTFYSFAALSALWLVLFFVCQRFSKEPSDPFAYQDMSSKDEPTTTDTTSVSNSEYHLQ